VPPVSRRRLLTTGAAALAGLAGLAPGELQAHDAARDLPREALDDPKAALAELLAGNQRFVDGRIMAPHRNMARLKEVAPKQTPFAAFLGCADSRVPIEIVFDQGFGDLFPVRVAGNVVTPEVMGSLEFGTLVLGAKVLMVLGHSSCGAVAATMKGDAVPGQISALYQHIVPATDAPREPRRGDPRQRAHPDAAGEALTGDRAAGARGEAGGGGRACRSGVGAGELWGGVRRGASVGRERYGVERYAFAPAVRASNRVSLTPTRGRVSERRSSTPLTPHRNGGDAPRATPACPPEAPPPCSRANALNYQHLLYFWVVAREGAWRGDARAEPRAADDQRAAQGARAHARRAAVRAPRAATWCSPRWGSSSTATPTRSSRSGASCARRSPGCRGPTGRCASRWACRTRCPSCPPCACSTRRSTRPGASTSSSGSARRSSCSADLAVHALDLVLADAPVPPGLGVRAFHHLLGTSEVTVFGTEEMARRLADGFPGSLDGAPWVLQTSNTALRRSLDQWFAESGVRPRVMAEVEDVAILQVLGQEGLGVFAAPTVVEAEIRRAYRVRAIGRLAGVRERFLRHQGGAPARAPGRGGDQRGRAAVGHGRRGGRRRQRPAGGSIAGGDGVACGASSPVPRHRSTSLMRRLSALALLLAAACAPARGPVATAPGPVADANGAPTSGPPASGAPAPGAPGAPPIPVETPGAAPAGSALRPTGTCATGPRTASSARRRRARCASCWPAPRRSARWWWR
jgi:carbonic anhydrase